MTGDVFEEDPPETGAEFTGNAGDIGPEVSLIIGALALSCSAERLAGVSGEEGVEGPGEWAGIEGGDIVPDRGVGQVSCRHCRDEDGSGVWLPFDVAARVEARIGKTEAHIQAAASSAEGEAVKGT